MATRFYFPATGNSASVTVDPSTRWGLTTDYNAFEITTVKTDTPLTDGISRAPSGVNLDTRLDRQYISAPLAAQTISGTYSCVIEAKENANTANAWLDIRLVIVSNDGSTVRGILYSGSTATVESGTFSDENAEFATLNRTRIKDSLALTNISAQTGDRLVVEIGYKSRNTNTSRTSLIVYGDPVSGGDAALTAQVDLINEAPWLELSQDILWAGAGNNINGSASFNGSGTLSALGTSSISKTAALSGSSILDKAVVANINQNSNLTGTGNLTVSSTNLSVTANANFSGAGTFSAEPEQIQAEIGTFTGSATGALSTTSSTNINQTNNLSSSGTLTRSTSTNINQTSNLSSSGTLTAIGISSIVGTANFSSSGILTNLQENLSVQTAANFSTIALLDSQTEGSGTSSFNSSATGTLSVNTSSSFNTAINLISDSTLSTSTDNIAFEDNIDFSAENSLFSSSLININNSSYFSTETQLNTINTRSDFDQEVSLNSIAELSVSDILISQNTVAFFTSESELNSSTDSSGSVIFYSSASGVLSVNTSEIAFSNSVNFSTSNLLSINTEPSVNTNIIFETISTLNSSIDTINLNQLSNLSTSSNLTSFQENITQEEFVIFYSSGLLTTNAPLDAEVESFFVGTAVLTVSVLGPEVFALTDITVTMNSKEYNSTVTKNNYFILINKKEYSLITELSQKKYSINHDKKKYIAVITPLKRFK